MAVKERERWPDAGFAVARRSLRHVAARYNDQTIQCIVCFVCGSQQITVENFDGNDEKKPIQYVGRAFFEKAENSCPGTLLNNCSYDLWKARYVDAGLQEEDNSDQQLTGPRDRNKHLRQAVEKERQSSSDQSWLDDWVLNVEIVHQDNHGVELQDEQGNPIISKSRLFGCMEDSYCKKRATKHA